VPYIIIAVILVFALSRGIQRVLTALALDFADAWTVTALSLLISSLIWMPIAFAKGWLRLDKQLWIKALPLSIINIAIPAAAFTFAQLYVTAGVAALFVAFLPAVVAVSGWIFLKEKISIKVGIGILLATGGIAALTFGRGGSLDVLNWWLGVGLLLIGIVSAALVYVGWRELLKTYSAVVILGPQLFYSTLMVIPVALTLGTPNYSDIVNNIFVLTILGVANYIVPQLAMFWLIMKTTAVRSSLANYLAPVVAVILGASLLGEEITPLIVFGGLLIISGAILVNASKNPSNVPSSDSKLEGK
jgi:drug/metabolite transporter (DMT)-like permease